MVVAGLDSNTREKLFALYRQGDFAGLADQIQLLLESFPNDPMLPSLMGAAQMELGDYQLAVKYYQRALQLRPGFEKLLNSLGICYLKLNRVTDAKESFEQALKRNPEFAPAWFNLGLVYENGQHWQQVERERFQVRVGQAVEVRRASLGSFFMKKVGTNRSTRVKRVD